MIRTGLGHVRMAKSLHVGVRRATPWTGVPASWGRRRPWRSRWHRLPLAVNFAAAARSRTAFGKRGAGFEPVILSLYSCCSEPIGLPL